MKLREILRQLAWLLPAMKIKNALLRRLGHDVHPDASVGPNLVLNVDRFEVAPHGRIAPFNVIKHMALISLGPHARIGRMNVISSHPVYANLYPEGASLHLAARSKITSRHSLDCSGGLRLGELASLAGRQTLVMTHGIDLGRDSQVAYPVTIGERSFVGARCVVLGGADLPSRSVLGAGSVLPRSRNKREAGVWAGAPAAYRGPKEGLWFDRDSTSTRRVYVPATNTMVDDAF